MWICKSPFRKNHKRKNWYVDVSIIPEQAESTEARSFTVEGNPVRVYEGEQFKCKKPECC